MKNLLQDLVVVIIGLLGTCVIGLVVALLWFRSVGREVDREAVLLAAKIFEGIFIGGILLFFLRSSFSDSRINTAGICTKRNVGVGL
jgi:hypothetical protein